MEESIITVAYEGETDSSSISEFVYETTAAGHRAAVHTRDMYETARISADTEGDADRADPDVMALQIAKETDSVVEDATSSDGIYYFSARPI